VADPAGAAPVTIAERLAFLTDAGVVTPTAARLTSKAIDEVTRRLGPIDDEPLAPLATHLAMALTRVDRAEPEAELPAIADAELASRPDERAFAVDLAQRWAAELGRPIPEGEISYVALHIAALAEARP
jgi:hypothetical protein